MNILFLRLERGLNMKKNELENIRVKYQVSITLKDSEGQIQWGRYNAMLVINTILIFF